MADGVNDYTPIPKSPPHKRMNPDEYRPRVTARQRAFHMWLIESFACFCGCGGNAQCVHHPLSEHPEQGTRRNHEYVVPMTDKCHKALHRIGSEDEFAGHLDFAEGAAEYRAMGQRRGLL